MNGFKTQSRTVTPSIVTPVQGTATAYYRVLSCAARVGRGISRESEMTVESAMLLAELQPAR